MIKQGQTFYAVIVRAPNTLTFDGKETGGRVHGPFVCTDVDGSFVYSEGRKFERTAWEFRRANKKLLQQSVTDVQNVERTL